MLVFVFSVSLVLFWLYGGMLMLCVCVCVCFRMGFRGY